MALMNCRGEGLHEEFRTVVGTRDLCHIDRLALQLVHEEKLGGNMFDPIALNEAT